MQLRLTQVRWSRLWSRRMLDPEDYAPKLEVATLGAIDLQAGPSLWMMGRLSLEPLLLTLPLWMLLFRPPHWETLTLQQCRRRGPRELVRETLILQWLVLGVRLDSCRRGIALPTGM